MNIKQFLAQLLFVAALGGLLAMAIHNWRDNLVHRGIVSGFDFLSKPSGFDLLFSFMPFDASDSYGHAFIAGALNTLALSAAGLFLATAIGVALGICLVSGVRKARWAARAYVEFFRNIPLLLHLFIFYFVVLRALPLPRDSHAMGDSIFLNIRGLYLPWPQLTSPWQTVSAWTFLVLLIICMLVGVKAFLLNAGLSSPAGHREAQAWWRHQQKLLLAVGLTALAGLIAILGAANWQKPALVGLNFDGGLNLVPEFVALLLALSLYTAAFIGEIVRSGIEAVPKGQREAALALGLRPEQLYRFILIPQSLRLAIPPLISQYLNLLKNSSLAAAIAYPDVVLIFAGAVLNQTGQAVEIVAMIMVFYMIVSLSISLAMNRLGHSETSAPGRRVDATRSHGLDARKGAAP